MRRYEIKITDQAGAPKVVYGGVLGGVLFNGTYASANALQRPIPGALNVVMDLPVSVLTSPLGGAAISIFGVGIPLLMQSANFNPSIDGKRYCNIEISGGMAKGLPLANPSQYGVLLKSRIQQAYGNWQGTSQSLDLIMVQPIGSIESPLNFSFYADFGDAFEDAIRITLKRAFPEATVNINIDPKLISPEHIYVQNFDFVTFAQFLKTRSKEIIGGSTYPGITATYIDNVINVFDYSTPSLLEPIQIKFTELIGQPTWIGSQTITFKTVMRSDIKVGGQIKMPEKSSQLGLILNTPNSYSQFRNSSAFQGTFFVQSVRHLGDFRQPDANSWVTVVQAAAFPNNYTFGLK
jgi:hypothetical protein